MPGQMGYMPILTFILIIIDLIVVMCILELPQNVTAIVENQYDVNLTWEPPEG